MRKKILLSALFALLALCSEAKERVEIGQRAYVKLVNAQMSFLARIDSGARISSLHAQNIVLEGEKSFIYAKKADKLLGLPFYPKTKNDEFKFHIGRIISFDTLNEKGEKRRIEREVIDVAKVTNAQGTEYRYVVLLGLEYGGVVKYKEVNLRDRSQMNYKLLIGRNWLDDDFVIKTDKGERGK